MEARKRDKLQWEYSVATVAANFTTVTIKHPLNVVQTRFQGLYAGFLAGALGSTISSALAVFFYAKAKQRHAMSGGEEKFVPDIATAVEAGAFVCLCTNPIALVKTRLQLQTPLHLARSYSGLYDAFRTIKREEGFGALFRGVVPGLFMVSRVAISLTVYKELCKIIVDSKTKEGNKIQHQNPDQILNSVDYAVLGATTKLATIIPIYPFHVIRTRLQQRPDGDGIPRYRNSWHVVKETARFEGVRGFYKGITPTLLINIPVASMTFIVYENVLKLLKLAKRND